MTLLPPERAPRPDLRREPPVQWLSVAQLLRTAVEVVQASMFARFADRREVMASCPREFYVLRPLVGDDGQPRPVRVDFVADTGDGFDATFATARCLTGSVEVVGETTGRRGPADLLVLGGDQVYPVASATAYERRLNRVLLAAPRPSPATAGSRDPELARTFSLAPSTTPVEAGYAPPVVALPGNHDWYDGLSAFRRNFCESWVKGRRPEPGGPDDVLAVPVPAADDVGGWGAFQSRSYFAVQLCDRWWLWGVDGQLDAPVDAEQLAYFREAAGRLSADTDAVILCVATPSWLEADGPEPAPGASADTPLGTLVWFVDRVLGERRDLVRLVLTGDEHHYARFTPSGPDPRGPELVTCGGGGAFLAGTHHLPEHLAISWTPWADTTQVTRYERAAAYPDADTCRAILRPSPRGDGAGPRWGFLAAAWSNGWGLPALIGLVGFFFLHLPVVQQQWVRLGWLAGLTLVLLGAFALSGVKGRHLRGWRRTASVAGLAVAHLLGQLPAPLLLAWLASALAPTGVAGVLFDIGAFVVIATAGMLAFVTYIRVADRWGFHALEAFSGLRVEDYKSHLRLRVTAEEVTVAVIAIDAVPRMAGHDPTRPPGLAARVHETFSVRRRP